MCGTNQIGTNTCHHNKKSNWILNHSHLYWNFEKSLINEYSDQADDRYIMPKIAL